MTPNDRERLEGMMSASRQGFDRLNQTHDAYQSAEVNYNSLIRDYWQDLQKVLPLITKAEFDKSLVQPTYVEKQVMTITENIAPKLSADFARLSKEAKITVHRENFLSVLSYYTEKDLASRNP